VVSAVADGGELALPGGEDFDQERLGACGDAVHRGGLGRESSSASRLRTFPVNLGTAGAT